jgi:dTDP-glucose pyrophosphorylase
MRQQDAIADLNDEQARCADAGIKGMITIGRPFLDYVISALADAGIREVVLVVGPEHGAVRDYFERVSPPQRVQVRFAEQARALGTADAVVAAAKVVGTSSFIVLNADNYYPVQAYRELVNIEGAAVIAFDRDALVRESNIDAARLRTFAVLDIAPDGTLAHIVEKPGASLDLSAPSARWVGMNCWKMSPPLVDACRRVSLSVRGEFELPEAVALALSEGAVVQTVKIAAGVLDLSQRSDIPLVIARLAHIVPRP